MPHVRRPLVALAGAGALAAASLSTAAAAHAATPVTDIDPALARVNLLTINDFHGRIDETTGPSLACTLRTAETALGSSMFVSSGDNIGASLFVSSSQEDNPTLDYLNALGLDVSAVGNHEFDKGFGDLTGRVADRADFPYLGANVYERGSTTPALPEYHIQEVGGLRVAVIGAVTQQTATMVSPTGVSGITFGDPVDAVNRVADRLTDGDSANGEADVLVASYHEGAPTASSLADATAQSAVFAKIVGQTSPKVGAILTAHTHLAYTWDGATTPGTRPVIQSNSYGTLLGQVSLGVDPATKKVTQYVQRNIATAPVTDWCRADPTWVAAAGIVTDANAQAKILGRQVVGSITADITTAYSDAKPVNGVYTGTKRDDRTRESTLGNLTAQVWLEAMNQPGRPGADIGIMNPGGLRADLLYKAPIDPATGQPVTWQKDGDVTYEEVASVHPFANTLQTKDITGTQLDTLLEQQWQPAGASRPFLKLGLSKNVTYTYDPTRAKGDRVTSILVNGKRVDPAATYTVASSSFLIGGGDSFTVLQDVRPFVDSGLVDTDAFINHFRAKSPVAPSYAKHSVAVMPLPAKVNYGKTTAFRMEGFDLTSLGAPVNTSAKVTIDGRSVQTVPISPAYVATPLPTRNGVATVSFKLTGRILPDDTPRWVDLKVVADPSPTTVTMPVRVKG